MTDSTVWKHTAAHTASLAPPLSHTHTHSGQEIPQGGGGGCVGVQGKRHDGAGTEAGEPVGQYGFVVGCRVVHGKGVLVMVWEECVFVHTQKETYDCRQQRAAWVIGMLMAVVICVKWQSKYLDTVLKHRIPIQWILTDVNMYKMTK